MNRCHGCKRLMCEYLKVWGKLALCALRDVDSRYPEYLTEEEFNARSLPEECPHWEMRILNQKMNEGKGELITFDG